MERIKVVLCAACDQCPAVEIDDEGVTIGEGRNIVKLTHAEWKDLVARIRGGQLGEA